MSASSQWDDNHAANQGRLHFQGASGKGGSWTARRNDVYQWLQIDLGNQQTKVTGVATQGTNGQNQWVTKYRLQYGEDGEKFPYYIEQGENEDKVRNDSSSKESKFFCSLLKCTEIPVKNSFSKHNDNLAALQVP